MRYPVHWQDVCEASASALFGHCLVWPELTDCHYHGRHCRYSLLVTADAARFRICAAAKLRLQSNACLSVPLSLPVGLSICLVPLFFWPGPGPTRSEGQSSNGGSTTQLKWIRALLRSSSVSGLRLFRVSCVPSESLASFAPHLFVYFGTRLFALPVGPTTRPRTRTNPKDLQSSHVCLPLCACLVFAQLRRRWQFFE